MSAAGTLVHGTAVLVGPVAVLIRGASGSGKSTLALRLLERAEGAGRFARLVADDQVFIRREGEALIGRAPETTLGLIELRGRGILELRPESPARIGLIVDLLPGKDCPRMPAPEDETVELLGLTLPRQIVMIGAPDAALIIESALFQRPLQPLSAT
ncbi:MAG: HPr kinase/phosphatase C-terminal domain-containing protein [Hyphomicrobiales bacterium]